MRRKALGLVFATIFMAIATVAPSVLAGPVTTLTACLKVDPGAPLGTAVYSSWDEDTSRLEISVAGAAPGTYCIFVDKVRLDANITLDDTGSGSLRLDTRWGDVIPVIVLGSKISLKNCADTTIVLCGTFK